MRSRLLSLFFAFFFALRVFAVAADAPPPPELAVQLASLIHRVEAKVNAGKDTEADYADEIKEFDALLAAHQGEKTPLVADAAYLKALLYFQAFNEPEKAIVLFQQFVQDYPDSTHVPQITQQILPGLKTYLADQAEEDAIRRTLTVGAQFPDFSVKDLDGQPLSVASDKGKVTLIDFWATWCGPCMAEMPNVIATYAKYHDQGFDIIGISLDKENQHDALVAFLKTNHMPWRQYYDGKYWQNALALKYGVQAIPQSYLLDRTGKIIAVEPRGPELAAAVEKALAVRPAGQLTRWLVPLAALVVLLLAFWGAKKMKTGLPASKGPSSTDV